MQIRQTFIITTALTLGGLALALALPAAAQNSVPAGEKRENVEYFSMTFIDFKPGRMGDAIDIINDHFKKAGAAAGTPEPIIIHFQSGRYDAANYWVQTGGLADLEWVATPDDAKWWAAMIAQEGSEKKAEKVMDAYRATVASEYRVIGHRHLKDDAE